MSSCHFSVSPELIEMPNHKEIEGVRITPLRRIGTSKGEVLHVLKCSDSGYRGFGEAYFSKINTGEIKGWKKHRCVTLNIVVPVGEICFMICDARPDSSTQGCFQDVILSSDNYVRLTIPPKLWVAFEGRSAGENILLNVVDTEHDPSESVNVGLGEICNPWFPRAGIRKKPDGEGDS